MAATVTINEEALPDLKHAGLEVPNQLSITGPRGLRVAVAAYGVSLRSSNVRLGTVVYVSARFDDSPLTVKPSVRLQIRPVSVLSLLEVNDHL